MIKFSYKNKDPRSPSCLEGVEKKVAKKKERAMHSKQEEEKKQSQVNLSRQFIDIFYFTGFCTTTTTTRPIYKL